MTDNYLGEIRRSSVLMNYGAGAIVNFRVGTAPVSVIAGGQESWENRVERGNQNEQSFSEARLAHKHNCTHFLPPPVKADDDDTYTNFLEGVRFPTWLQCPECNELKRAQNWGKEPGRSERWCTRCSANKPKNLRVHVVPVRFIVTCERGHISDFPWDYWITSHNEGCKSKKSFVLESQGAGLAGLVLKCSSCGARRNLESIFQNNALGGFKCLGSRPWLPDGNEECDLQPTVLQRGASNVYFPQFDSAISIPPWTNTIETKLGQYWYSFREVEPEDYPMLLRAIKVPAGLEDESDEDLLTAIHASLQLLKEPSTLNLRWDEYQQLTKKDSSKSPDFETKPEPLPKAFEPWFNRIVRVSRLREVRIQTGFTRIESRPGAVSSKGISIEEAPISLSHKNWLPGIEVRGEGIFIELNSDRLKEWSRRPAVMARVSGLIEKLQNESRVIFESDKVNLQPDFAARFYLLHTFSHILIRQLSMQSGYSSASLRERIYSGSDPTESNGILIYTSSPDSDGTLGGLQRLGKPEKILSIIKAGLENVEWCSSDPLCIEGLSSRTQDSNLAACHACVMVSETSCEEFNHFLDRALLTGFEQLGIPSFFEGMNNISFESTETD